jgi:hypothetical protein
MHLGFWKRASDNLAYDRIENLLSSSINILLFKTVKYLNRTVVEIFVCYAILVYILICEKVLWISRSLYDPTL